MAEFLGLPPEESYEGQSPLRSWLAILRANPDDGDFIISVINPRVPPHAKDAYGLDEKTILRRHGIEQMLRSMTPGEVQEVYNTAVLHQADPDGLYWDGA